MNILIVEDEILIANRIQRMVKELQEQELYHITIKQTIESATFYLAEQPIDLLFLDLNLNGRDGFQLLKEMVASSFHTIIISANTDKAITAFEYGVLDFIPKPFNKDRIKKALEKYHNLVNDLGLATKYLAIKKQQNVELIDIDEILFIKGAGNYSEIYQRNNKKELHNKTLQKLMALLPSKFERLHKSYIVNMTSIEAITNNYKIQLVDGTILPISRASYKKIKNRT